MRARLCEMRARLAMTFNFFVACVPVIHTLARGVHRDIGVLYQYIKITELFLSANMCCRLPDAK